jgi:two-component system, NarL family, response regulator NreC
LGRLKRTSQIFIADGHLLFRRGLRSLLEAESDLEVIGEAADAAEASAKIALARPNILVMDVALLEGAGAQNVFAIRQANPSLAILFLTQEDGPHQLERAIEAGGRGYMLKGSPAGQLVAGIRQVAFSDDKNPRGLSRIVPDLRALAATNQAQTRTTVLTSREQEVMRLLAEGRTVREVAGELALSVKTVEAHKLNLMRKLDIHNRASLVEYAAQQGWITAQLAS